MKYGKWFALALVVLCLVFLIGNWIFYPIQASTLSAQMDNLGSTLDQAETKGSILFLISDAQGRQLIHCQRGLLFSRYRIAETIDITSNSGNYGFRDWFHTFSAEVSGDTVTIHPESIQSRFSLKATY